MVMPGRITQQIESLPQHPPTPPRDSVPDGALKSTYASQLFSKESGTQPSLRSSSPVIDANKSTIDRGLHKKVEWSEFLDSDDSPRQRDLSATPSNRALRPLPSSDNKPIKSILKPYNGFVFGDEGLSLGKLSHSHVQFATMLESIVKQLAGSDRNSRIDAYLTLSGVLKATDNVPNINALKEKLGLISQFILRDMTAGTNAGASDAVVANHALTLLASLLWKIESATCLSSDFCVQVVEHAIAAFESPITSKDAVKHLMFIIANQNFSPKIMSLDRMARILASLQTIESHVKGRSIVVGRITIYQRLLRQNKMAMLANTDWIDHLFTDMLSSFADIKSPAVAFGLEAALKLGTMKQPSRAVMKLFKAVHDQQLRYPDFYSSRLSAMIKKKQDSAMVPQIWTVVVLFLRYRPRQFEQWEHLTLWLRILEECFNCSDYEVKIQANLAWSRLVYSTKLDESTRVQMIKMLLQPLNAQIKRRSRGRGAKEARKSAITSVCNLLYYSMRPMASFEQLDLYWDEYVTPLIGSLLTALPTGDPDTVSEDARQACAILGALLNANGPVNWYETRATEAEPIHADELPGLDPRWIRKNAARIFSSLRPLVDRLLLDMAAPKSQLSSVWQSFISSVAVAGSKEIKVANETMTVIAHFFNLIATIWHRGPNYFAPTEEATDTFVTAFANMTTTFIKELGFLPFTDKLLSVGQQDTFIVVATPSQRASKLEEDIRSPLHHLTALIAQGTPGVSSESELLTMSDAVFRPFFDDQRSKWARIELARNLSQILPECYRSSISARVPWQCFAKIVHEAMAHGGANSSSSNEQPLGAEYRNIVEILEVGATIGYSNYSQAWEDLFLTACKQATLDAGDTGRAISIIEPLAKGLASLVETSSVLLNLNYLIQLIDNAAYPRERQALHAAQRRLWGTAVTTRRSSFDPFNFLYSFISTSLSRSYDQLSVDHLDTCGDACSSVSELIRRCSNEHLAEALMRIQGGLSAWIRDGSLKLGSRTVSMLSVNVVNLWTNICACISRLPRIDSSLLGKLEPLICAGLDSKHKSIVSATVVLWNATFGVIANLEYPSDAEKSLRSLRSVADLQLPNFPLGSSDVLSCKPPSYVEESQVDDSFMFGPPTSSRSVGTRRSSSPISSRKRRGEDDPQTSSKRRTFKRNLMPKCRHDDSQIQFEAIVSSPPGSVEELILTDRQREVRDRQEAEVAIFPELRSSPSTKAKTPAHEVGFTKTSKAATALGITKPSTPDLSKANKAFDAFITSSPTPRRGTVVPVLDSDAMEPPSSPPEPIQSETYIPPVETSIMSVDYELLQNDWDVPSSPPERSSPVVELRLSLPEDGPLPRSTTDLFEGSLNKLATTNNMAIEASTNQGTPLRETNTADVTLHTPKTQTDVFVDAVTSPSQMQSKGGFDIGTIGTGGMAQLTRRTESSSPQHAEFDESSALKLIDQVDQASEIATTLQDVEVHGVTRSQPKPVKLSSQTTSLIRGITKAAEQSPASENSTTNATSIRRSGRTRKNPRMVMLQSTIPETPDRAAIVVKDTSAPMLTTLEQPQYNKRRRTSARASQISSSADSQRLKPIAAQEEVLDGQNSLPNAGIATTDFAESATASEALVAEAQPRRRGRSSKNEEMKRALELEIQKEEERREMEMRLQMSIEAQSQEEELAMAGMDKHVASVELGDISSEEEQAEESTDEEMNNNPEEDSSISVEETVEGANAASASNIEVATTTSVAEVEVEATPASSILAQLSSLLQSLKGANLTRDEVGDIEDTMWDCKTELGKARERGKGLEL